MVDHPGPDERSHIVLLPAAPWQLSQFLCHSRCFTSAVVGHQLPQHGQNTSASQLDSLSDPLSRLLDNCDSHCHFHTLIPFKVTHLPVRTLSENFSLRTWFSEWPFVRTTEQECDSPCQFHTLTTFTVTFVPPSPSSLRSSPWPGHAGNSSCTGHLGIAPPFKS